MFHQETQRGLSLIWVPHSSLLDCFILSGSLCLYCILFIEFVLLKICSVLTPLIWFVNIRERNWESFISPQSHSQSKDFSSSWTQPQIFSYITFFFNYLTFIAKHCLKKKKKLFLNLSKFRIISSFLTFLGQLGANVLSSLKPTGRGLGKHLKTYSHCASWHAHLHMRLTRVLWGKRVWFNYLGRL